jgi:hypothetical protein
MAGRHGEPDFNAAADRAPQRIREGKMSIQLKLSGALYQQMMRDFARPHRFAGERVGFASGRLGGLMGDGRLILLTVYHPIPDEYYIEDPHVGARINSEAITRAMHAVYHGRLGREGIFHVHLHQHRGQTAPSKTDWREIPAMMPGFQAVGRQAAHGMVILSADHGSAWVWLPGRKEPTHAEGISVIGVPIQVFDQKAL